MTSRMKKIALTLALTAALPFGQLSAAGEPSEVNADNLEYDMSTGLAVATGDVLLKQGTSKMTGAKATYNTKTQEGTIEGNVIVVRDTLRMTCERLVTNGQQQLVASGGVQGVDGAKSFTATQVEYYPTKNKYIKIPGGGTLVDKEGTISASYMEGWLDDEHYIGEGNVHVLSGSRNLEAGGDHADFVGKKEGRVVLTGNAWAIQDNNTMKSNKMTLYLDQNGKAKAKAVQEKK